MPNKENIQKWVDALRSGLYKQNFGSLHQLVVLEGQPEEWHYCALGIANHLHNIETGAGFYSSLTDWLGLPSKDANNLFLSIIDLNDMYSKTFPEIADFIEKQLSLVAVNAE